MILQNSVKCLRCDEVIWSAHRHDYHSCSCGNIAVDGGLEYLRRVGNNLETRDLSVSVPKHVTEDLKEAVFWAKDTGRNELGIALAVIRVLQKNGILGSVYVKGE